jgi:hypothetical protein
MNYQMLSFFVWIRNSRWPPHQAGLTNTYDPIGIFFRNIQITFEIKLGWSVLGYHMSLQKVCC